MPFTLMTARTYVLVVLHLLVFVASLRVGHFEVAESVGCGGSVERKYLKFPLQLKPHGVSRSHVIAYRHHYRQFGRPTRLFSSLVVGPESNDFLTVKAFLSSFPIHYPGYLEVLGIYQGPQGPCIWSTAPTSYLQDSIGPRMIHCSCSTGGRVS